MVVSSTTASGFNTKMGRGSDESHCLNQPAWLMDGGILIQDIFHVEHEFAYNFKGKGAKKPYICGDILVTPIQFFSQVS